MNIKLIRNDEFDSTHYVSKIKLKLLSNIVYRKIKLLKYNTNRLAIINKKLSRKN